MTGPKNEKTNSSTIFAAIVILACAVLCTYAYTGGNEQISIGPASLHKLSTNVTVEQVVASFIVHLAAGLALVVLLSKLTSWAILEATRAIIEVLASIRELRTSIHDKGCQDSSSRWFRERIRRSRAATSVSSSDRE